MQAGDRERAPGLDLAGDMGIIERALRPQSDIGRLGIALVALLERRLHGAQRSGIHLETPVQMSEIGWHMSDVRGQLRRDGTLLLSQIYDIGPRAHVPAPDPC